MKKRCPGSGERGLDGRWPGDSDRCRYCGRLVRVQENLTVRAHDLPKAPLNGVRAWGGTR